MRVSLVPALLIALGCSREAPSAAAPPTPPPPAAAATPPASARAIPAPEDPPPPKFRTVPSPPAGSENPISCPTPLFTFASLDGTAEVRINGAPCGSTPHAWTAARFDPGIPVRAWPPPHAMLASRVSVHVDEGWSTTELWIAGAKNALDDREAFRAAHPGVPPDEHVVFVKTGLEGRPVFGAFRLRVEGRRFVLHRPAHVSEESEDFHRWNRVLWFERE
jgi:hypothetical protein